MPVQSLIIIVCVLTKPEPFLKRHNNNHKFWLYCCTAERCTRSLYSDVYSTLWYRSRCYMAFLGRVSWLEAASMCVHRHGILASFHDIDTDTVQVIRASFVPHSCAWVGLVKKYLYWTTHDSQLFLIINNNLTYKTRYVCLFVCMLPMAGRTAGPIKTKLGIGTHVDPRSVLVKVMVKVI